MRSYLAKSIVVGLGILLASPAPMALATSDLTFRWMEVLVSRVELTYRELHLLNYRSGLTPTGFQVPGWVNLHEYKVGDHLLASAYLRKTPPPTGDKQYEEALRRLLAEEGRTP
jgi:hypothetical protein